MLRRLLIAVALIASASHSASAQRLGRPEKRPKLPAGADTNDAAAYFAFGRQSFAQDPEAAAAAFYWAARINPAWGEPLYARRAALLMQNGRLLKQVMEGNKRALESDEVRRLDSLN